MTFTEQLIVTGVQEDCIYTMTLEGDLTNRRAIALAKGLMIDAYDEDLIKQVPVRVRELGTVVIRPFEQINSWAKK